MASAREAESDNDSDGEASEDPERRALDYVSRVLSTVTLQDKASHPPHTLPMEAQDGILHCGLDLKKSPITVEDGEVSSLLLLPLELIIHILSFLDARFILGVLPLVCRTLKDIVSEKMTWRVRVQKRVSSNFPVVEHIRTPRPLLLLLIPASGYTGYLTGDSSSHLGPGAHEE
ncbi:hypothetical protein GDO81_022957 [Engystomops pustulosus]|uniref:F-box domain-containing protein n=1 Tax=Engystomops pustulosus TaxID=76066 RepID=A0AAV6ZMV1_ENGPU|nr:hypothetical protein GDO81_022957 [Engystomops pustulosus]